MDQNSIVEVIKQKFNSVGHLAHIRMLRGGYFTTELVDGGIKVDNLGNQPFLPWSVFQEAIWLIIHNGGHAERGDAMSSRLGDK